ncbi:MAG: molybdopterin molybdotransferase MoeA [Candidatus Korarchaeum sp.]|nr:molybdopterin molybdotransferase MoeA [Candidatus Korarchaeum sp.]MDW8035706.1 molybdopterin molybdotransferase MoeA [Candidatus Korarchaeum sp.]
MSKLFSKLTRVEDALSVISSYLEPLPSERVSTHEALGRVLAEDLFSHMDMPPYDRVAFDGYAVRAEDTFGASKDNPVLLRLRGTSFPGEEFEGELANMEAVEVGTGVPLPRGADAVVPLEHTRREGDYVEVMRQVAPGANVDRAGSDLRAGDLVLKRGTYLGPFELLAIASLNIVEVPVVRKPRICLIASGNELIELGSELKRGKVVNSNVLGVKSLIEELADVKYLGICRDELESLRSCLSACMDCDLIVTIAGSSVGERDYLQEAISSLDGVILVRGLSIMPGRPTLLAIINGKPLIGLPGYPVSAMVSTIEVLLPIIHKLLGIRGYPARTVIRAKLSQRVPSSAGVRHYVRVKLLKGDEGYEAVPVRVGGAGIVSSLVRADGFLVIPEEVEGYEEGTYVDVIVYRRWLDLEESLQGT